MELIVRGPDGDMPFYLGEHATELLEQQWDIAARDDALPDFLSRLSEHLAHALTHAVDWKLQPPTNKQVTFATAIVRELGISLPADALRYRGAMSDFLARFAEQFQRRRGM